MTREKAKAYSTYAVTGNGISSEQTLVFKPKAFNYLIDKIYDSLETRIAELEAPKTCDDCKFYDVESDFCLTYDSMIFGVKNQWGCSDYEPKDSK